MRMVLAGIGLAIASATLATVPQAHAQTIRESQFQLAQVYQEAPPPRRRPRVRIYQQQDDRGVSPSYNPGPNAVRDCSATYVQEFRPSGTVITPRLNCYWRRG